MQVNQIYEIMNTVTSELLGETAVVNEDLSNIVDLGKSFENAAGLDNYVKALNDVVGKMVFVNKVYKGRAPSVLMDGWEYGSILEKITAELPEATENESWELSNGASYDPNIFYKPSVSVKCYNERVTFEIPISITQKQVKESFNSAVQLNAFISMLYTAVENAMTLKIDNLIMRTINNFSAETIANAYSSTDYTGVGDTRAVNLLALYNATVDTAITAAEALKTPDFLKFASETILNYVDRMQSYSTLFNIGEKPKFTPKDLLHVVLLSEFKHASDVYLQSGTYNEQFTALPEAELVPFWQGSGTDYSFENASKIYVKTSGNNTVTASGILGVMFDRDALGVSNIERRVTSQFNPKGDFYNEWHKFEAGYFNDQNENFVVFFIANQQGV